MSVVVFLAGFYLGLFAYALLVAASTDRRRK